MPTPLNDSALVEAARKATGLSTGALAIFVGLDDDRFLRRALSGERDLPGSVRLLLQLIASRPDLFTVLYALRAGQPLPDADDLATALRILLEHLDMFPDAIAMIGPANVDIARRALAEI